MTYLQINTYNNIRMQVIKIKMKSDVGRYTKLLHILLFIYFIVSIIIIYNNNTNDFCSLERAYKSLQLLLSIYSIDTHTRITMYHGDMKILHLNVSD